MEKTISIISLLTGFLIAFLFSKTNLIGKTVYISSNKAPRCISFKKTCFNIK